MASIGDLFFSLHGDDSQLQLDVSKAGLSAGNLAGNTFSSAFGKIVKTAAVSLVGAGIGAAVGMALSGANQLDAATKQLMADTGMTATEAAKAETAIAGLYQHNLQGFADIGSAMSAVITKLHLTGDAATAATQLFLTFSTATGMNAADAVDNVSKALDAWNLTADQAGPLMDKLVAGHQNFKLSIADSETALQKIAPAMQAMGMSMDDGIGLLNLFASSGLDATKASLALNTAVKQLKPGQTLNDLIAQISSIQDPLARAQEATKLFGSRAGPQLAEALKPGITSLGQFNTTAAENAGATTKAADAVKSGFGAQMMLLLHQAGGALADFGTQFGGLAMLASAFGPTFTRAIGAAIGGIAPLLGPALRGMLSVFAAAGTEQGVAMGAAAVAGEGSTIVAGQAIVAAEATPAVGIAGTALGAAMGGAMAVAAIAATVALPAAILIAIRNAIGGPGRDNNTASQALWDEVSGGGPAATAAGTDAGKSFGLAVLEAAATVAPVTDATFAKMGTSAGQSFSHNLVTPAEAALASVGKSTAEFNAQMMTALSTTADRFKSTWSELDAIATSTADTIYGAQIRASDALANIQAQNAEKAIIASKKSTAQQVSDAKARLLALQDEGLKMQIEMVGRGEIVGKAYDALIATLNKQASSSNAEVANQAKLALAELAKLKAAALATASALAQIGLAKIYNTQGTKKNAGGGFLAAGETSQINELGQELWAPKGPYFTAPTDGYVISADRSAAIMAGQHGSGAPQITQTIYGIQADDVERQTLRALRRNQLQLQLSGGRG